MNIFGDPEATPPTAVPPSTFVEIDKPIWTRALSTDADALFFAVGLSSLRSVVGYLDIATPALVHYCDEFGRHLFSRAQATEEWQRRDELLAATVDVQHARLYDRALHERREVEIVALATMQCALVCVQSVVRSDGMNGLAEVIRELKTEQKRLVSRLSWRTLIEQFDLAQEATTIRELLAQVKENVHRSLDRYAASCPAAAPICANGAMDTFLAHTLNDLFERVGGDTHQADQKPNPFEWMDDIPAHDDENGQDSLIDDDVDGDLTCT